MAVSPAPLATTTSPRNIIVGHLIGVIAGYVSLVAFQLVSEPSAFATGASVARLSAAALSLGLTAAGSTGLFATHIPSDVAYFRHGNGEVDTKREA